MQHHELSHDVDDAADYARMMSSTDPAVDRDMPTGYEDTGQKK